MKQWEYKVLTTAYLSQYDTEKFGKEGWELCTMESSSTSNRYFFKRELTFNEEALRMKYPSVRLAHDQYLMLLKLAESGEIEK